MRRLIAFASALTISLVGCATADTEVSFNSTEVAPGIFMLEGVGAFTGGNLGLVTGEDGVILIDGGMPQYFATMSAAIEAKTNKAIDFVVNTHVHGDHIGNNANLSKSGATIIAHDKLRSRMVTDGVTGPDGDIPPTKHDLPEITYSDAVTVHLNGYRTHIFHASDAHTDGDSVVHFPEVNVIHAGDLFFNGLFPYIDLDSGGSVDGFIAAQDKILALADSKTKIISGHGPLGSKTSLQAARDMLVDSRDRVRKLVANGKSEADILKDNPLANYDKDWSWGFITTERMTKTLIRDASSGR